jgi:nucleoside-diphosphate kinase
VERTLILLKPDAVQRGLAGPIITRFEQRGLRIVGLKLVQVGEGLARQHYAVHEGKPFFPGLIAYITSGPVVAMAVAGPNAIAVVRATVGSTRPHEAAPGSIRADYGLTVGRNLVHASDSPANAAQELALWFTAGELLDYTRAIDPWILDE